MSDNNDFLNNYGKGASPEETEIVVRDAPLPSYKYEQKSDFKPPARDDTPPVPPGRKGLIIGIAVGALVLAAAVLLLVFLLNPGVTMIDPDGQNDHRGAALGEGPGPSAADRRGIQRQARRGRGVCAGRGAGNAHQEGRVPPRERIQGPRPLRHAGAARPDDDDHGRGAKLGGQYLHDEGAHHHRIQRHGALKSTSSALL